VNSNSSTGSQIPLAISLGDKAEFDNYLAGDNAELVATLKPSICDSEPQLLYMYGPSGVGKSHLLYAAMRLAQQHSIPTSYLSFRDERAEPDLLLALNTRSLICLDDVHCWAGNEEYERSLFAVFEQAKHDGGQLLLSSHQAPQECGFVLRDLVSRLASGLIYSVNELSSDQQFEAVKLRASLRGLKISDETVRYLLSRTSRDTSELFSTLDRIDQASLIEKRRITIPFLKTVLKI
jgi:DnaA family protein